MRKLMCLAALAALALTGCQQQPKQEMSANSPLDVRPVQKSTPLHMLPPTHDVTPPEEPDAPIVTATPAPAVRGKAAVAKAAAAPKSGAARPAAVANVNYTVRKGDTLYRIATVEYGDGKQWTKIASANPGVMPQSLHVGQTILIP